MTLRARLSLLVTLALLLGLFLSGTLAYVLFVQQQQAQLSELLLRDLERVQLLVGQGFSAVGARLVEDRGAFTLQFVGPENQVVLGGGEALPAADWPVTVVRDERIYLAASTPWILGAQEAGTIRLALDITDAVASRRNLLRSLLVSGAVIALVATVLNLALLNRALAPLARLAAAARRVDPASPAPIPYRGPHDEVANVAQALNRALRGIRKRQQAERASLAEIAHELAAPLTLVAGHLESLVAAHPQDPQLEAARGAAKELLYTSKDLLTLSRGELERPLDLQVLDLSAVVRRIAREYPGVALGALPAAEVAGSPERLAQLTRNLVRNAVQAAGAEGVTLELTAGADEVVLTVADRGPGVPPEELPHLFERFYTRRKQGGVGVGLSVAQQIVQQHGGRIAVASEVGVGTTFTVSLPSLGAQLEGGDDPTEDAVAPGELVTDG
ncbi:sensor histidine kinase [Truepera radiovictrix]|uniref:histidine kinase n=1 Tax=Truepera radiovictrix (strain DSM 17093 / CIP 108686 / LMG 22925 / RQ-24) TaxID=649638 RepID=D7CTG6_TRURR|nr:HAMP domain-containing sensor histidine kinase [Truepera radiovictrix]ADI13823.1 integral membrane sensor signal transduction histidine kinase [Truepera radiovictrix DSM 17093]WMT57612.1 HAMP domain-containing sensor histidine kinase [Truepera radiovictrix]